MQHGKLNVGDLANKFTVGDSVEHIFGSVNMPVDLSDKRIWSWNGAKDIHTSSSMFEVHTKAQNLLNSSVSICGPANLGKTWGGQNAFGNFVFWNKILLQFILRLMLFKCVNNNMMNVLREYCNKSGSTGRLDVMLLCRCFKVLILVGDIGKSWIQWML